MMFAALYKVLALLNLDTPLVMIKAPRKMQSIFSALGDLHLCKFPRVLFGDQAAKWATTNCTRTLSSRLETVLTIVGLYHWPCMRTLTCCNVSMVSRSYGLAAAALACAIRSTSAITWIYVGLLELIVAQDRPKFIFLEAALIGYSRLYSVLGHKEFRSLPVLPIALVFSGYHLSVINVTPKELKSLTDL
nr:PREDICTED: GPI mannosyltransferase 3-like [Daucus carota subsp. sativus]